MTLTRWPGSWAQLPTAVTVPLAGGGVWLGLFLMSPSTTETRLELLIRLGQQCRDCGGDIQHRGELTVAVAGSGCPQVQGSREGDSLPSLWSPSLLRGQMTAPPGDGSAWRSGVSNRESQRTGNFTLVSSSVLWPRPELPVVGTEGAAAGVWQSRGSSADLRGLEGLLI